MAIETITALIGALTGIGGIWYAFQANRKAVLRAYFINGDSRNSTGKEIILSKREVKFVSGMPEPLSLPILIENKGRKTAHEVRVTLKFPAHIEVLAHQNATVSNNPIEYNPQQITLRLSDLHPKEKSIIADLKLRFPPYFFYPVFGKGLPGDEPNTLSVIWIEKLMIDCILYQGDATPTYHQFYVYSDIEPPTESNLSHDKGYVRGGVQFVSLESASDKQVITKVLAEKIKILSSDQSQKQMVDSIQSLIEDLYQDDKISSLNERY